MALENYAKLMTGGAKSLVKPASPPDNREKLINQRFAEQGKMLEGEQGRALQRYQDQFKRFAAQNQLQGSGALLKAAGQQQQEIGKTFAEAQAGLGVEKSKALEQVASEKFQAAQLDKQLAETARQFNMEFDENMKTNFINAAIALKDSGLQNAGDWYDLIGKAGGLTAIYGSRAPVVTGPKPQGSVFGGSGQQGTQRRYQGATYYV